MKTVKGMKSFSYLIMKMSEYVNEQMTHMQYGTKDNMKLTCDMK